MRIVAVVESESELLVDPVAETWAYCEANSVVGCGYLFSLMVEQVVAFAFPLPRPITVG